MPACRQPARRVLRCSRLAAAALVCLAASAGVRAQQPGSAPSQADLTAASQAMRSGVEAANRNDLPTARSEFARAALLAPQVEPAHAALGSILLAMGEMQAAQTELQSARSLDPSDVSATLNLARVEVALGNSQEGLRLFGEALASADPPVLSAEEALAYATVLAAAGDAAGAQSQILQALQRTPNSAPLEDAYGSLLAQSSQMEQASAHFERASALDPALALAQYHLGTTSLLLGRPEAAIAPLRRAAAALPSYFDVHLQLGRALSATHQDEGALAALHQAAQLRTATTPMAGVYALAVALEASGDAAGSLPLFAVAVDGPGFGSAGLINYALARVQTGDAAGALPLYAKALTLGPDSPTLREDYGVAFLQKADLDHALEQFRAGLALDPQSAHLHYDLGLAYKLKDDLAQAVPELVRSAELDPSLPDPGYTLGVIYMQQGKYAEAAAQLRKATALQPSNGEAWAVLGGVLKDSDDTAGAVDALQHAIALEPTQPSLHVQLAALLVRTGHADQAATERKLAADLSRTAVSQQRASFALRSGRTLLEQGKVPEAIVQLTTAVNADPKLAESHTLLAEALTRQGKLAEAALERQRASALQPATSVQPANAPPRP